MPFDAEKTPLLFQPLNIKTVYQDERQLQRRITKTELFIDVYINQYFGSTFPTYTIFFGVVLTLNAGINEFLVALSQARPSALQALRERAESEQLAKIRKEFTKTSMRLLYDAGLTTKQWAILRQQLVFGGVVFLPCYRTITRFQKKGYIVDGMTTTEFFNYLEAGGRALVSTETQSISVKHRLCWILFIIQRYWGHHIHQHIASLGLDYVPTVTVEFRFLLWDDGGRVWGLPNGLFSALKGTLFYLCCPS